MTSITICQKHHSLQFVIKSASLSLFLAESKACGHANRAVNFSLVRKALKQGQPIGDCTQCRKGHCSDLKDEAEKDTEVRHQTDLG